MLRDVANDPHSDGNVFADRERRHVAGDAVVEPQPDSDDDVGVLDRPVHMHFAVHPRHAEVQRVRFREGADPEQGSDHGNAGLFRQRTHFGVCVPEDHAVADHHQGPLGRSDELGGITNPLLERPRARARGQSRTGANLTPGASPG